MASNSKHTPAGTEEAGKDLCSQVLPGGLKASLEDELFGLGWRKAPSPAFHRGTGPVCPGQVCPAATSQEMLRLQGNGSSFGWQKQTWQNPTLVKHSSPVPKRAQHSCFSSSYPFNPTPCTALLALWIAQNERVCFRDETCLIKNLVLGCPPAHLFFSLLMFYFYIFINMVKIINFYIPIHQFPLCTISH